MKRLLAALVLVALAALLSGCYVAPGYSYVRASPYAGPVYYGNAVVRNDGYYVTPGWYDGYYGGYYGCCYAPGVTIGGVWYRGGRGYRHGYGGGHDWHRGGRGYGHDGGHGRHDGDHHH